MRIVGVYHAKGTLLGELQYVVGKLLGLTHCGLCDLTHGLVKEKPSVVAWRTQAPWPVNWVHLDEQSPEVEVFTSGRTPCVVAVDGGICRLLLDADALDAMAGDEQRFFLELAQAIEALEPL